MTRRARIALLALVAGLLGPRVARADVSDLLGLDPRTRGMGMATVALCRDWSAAMCNPAGSAMADKTSIGFGYSWATLLGKINGAKVQVLDMRGIPFGVTTPFNLSKKIRAAVTVGGYLPDQFIGRISLVPAYEPRFVLLDNRPHRIVVTTALALRPVRWLSLAVGATIFANAAGNGITFNVGVKGGQKVGETEIDVLLPLRVAPVVGVVVQPKKWLKIGAHYRGELDLRLALDILANVDVAGIVTGDALITVRAVNYFTPHRLDLGVAVEPSAGLTLAANLVYSAWSRFSGGIPDLRVLVDLGLNPPLVQAFFPADNFRDTLSPRFGAEYKRDVKKGVQIAARVGYAYEPSPVPNQVGLPGLIDNDRHVFTVGGGFRIEKVASWYPHPLSFDLGFQYHLLAERRVVRNLLADPSGGGLVSSGSLISLVGTVNLEF